MDPAKWFPNSPALHGEAAPDPPAAVAPAVPQTDQVDRPLTMEERFYGKQATPQEVAASVQASPEGPPTEYKPFEVPEEFSHLGITHDQASFDAFVPIARELGLSQSAAQRLANLHLSRVYGAGK